MFNKRQVPDLVIERHIHIPVVTEDGTIVCVDRLSVADTAQALADAIGLQRVIREAQPLYIATKLPNKVAKKRQ